jgi:thioredoxin reductase (NADPH)
VLESWARRNAPRFELVRIVGEHWDPWSHRLRDALARNSVPFGFYERDSPERRQLLGQLDRPAPDHAVVFLRDGRVLTDFTEADVAAASAPRSGPSSVKRVASAVGEGSVAVQQVHQHLQPAP